MPTDQQRLPGLELEGAIAASVELEEAIETQRAPFEPVTPRRRLADPGIPTEDRFWALVDRRGPDECWLWRTELLGYPSFSVRGRVVRGHRFAYQLLVGPIPDGLVLDHLCRNKTCVNPAHLEPVTQNENSRRGQLPAWQTFTYHVPVDGEICRCGCGGNTNGWLYMKGHAPATKRRLARA